MWWNDYIRVPFQDKGRSMQGADCWGLGCLIYERERGIKLPDYLNFYDNSCDARALAKLINDEKQNWIEVTEPQEYDCVVIRMRNVPMHVGWVTKKHHMIHCAAEINAVHEKFTALGMKDRVLGFYRWQN